MGRRGYLAKSCIVREGGRRALSWREFTEGVTSLPGRWIYRGGLEHWTHETSLERACNAWKVPLRSARTVECRLVREFQRHPEVREYLLDADDYLGWLALMQHHGAPTRLLDWSYSPFVAAYFAFEALLSDRSKPANSVHAIVWALDVEWLARRIRHRLSPHDWRVYVRKDSPSFKKLFIDRRPALRLVGTAIPRMLNQRLSLQQGVFLCPGDVTRTWSENLSALAGARQRPRLRSFLMGRDAMEDAFRALKSMNVTARSLFPGVDGYAKSVAHRMRELWKTPVLGT